jgi:hypothetical protein
MCCLSGVLRFDLLITDAMLLCIELQVLFRSFILHNGYETSYICLARRAAKNNNFWNRLVRRGSTTRRLLLYGGLQLLFTVICCTVFLPTYYSFPLAFAYQVSQLACSCVNTA